MLQFHQHQCRLCRISLTCSLKGLIDNVKQISPEKSGNSERVSFTWIIRVGYETTESWDNRRSVCCRFFHIHLNIIATEWKTAPSTGYELWVVRRGISEVLRPERNTIASRSSSKGVKYVHRCFQWVDPSDWHGGRAAEGLAIELAEINTAKCSIGSSAHPSSKKIYCLTFNWIWIC